MADVDIDSFGEQESRPEEPTDECIPLGLVTPGREGVQTWDPSGVSDPVGPWEQTHDKETSFGGRSHTSVLHKEYLVGKICELIGNKIHQRLEPNSNLFILGEDGRLYYKGKPLMNRNGELKTIGIIVDTLGIGGLREMGYNISKTNLKPRFVLDLMEKQAQLPSIHEIAGEDEIEWKRLRKA